MQENIKKDSLIGSNDSKINKIITEEIENMKRGLYGNIYDN